MCELCKRFKLNFLKISNQPKESILVWESDEGDATDHFLPIICIIEIKEDEAYKIAYYPFSNLNTLYTLSLYSHHNYSTHSQVILIT